MIDIGTKLIRTNLIMVIIVLTISGVMALGILTTALWLAIRFAHRLAT